MRGDTFSEGQGLFSQADLGPYRLRNRAAMAPMTRNRAGADGVPTPMMAEYYAQRAEAGLIITESTQVSPQGRGYPGTPGIHDDAQVEAWAAVVAAVHARGGLIFVQLWHAGRQSHPLVQPDGVLPVAPSAIAPDGMTVTGEGMKPFVAPRALETAEIAQVVAEFRAAAENARRAGFDGVEINAANGYLIDQFLRDGSNRRDDRYGGSPQNRARFLIEIVESVTAILDPQQVGVRLSPTNPFGSMSDADPSTTFGHAAAALNGRGLAYLHGREAGQTDFDWAAWRRRFQGPYIANGGYDLERAQAAIASGSADLVSFGALYLANPDLLERFRRRAPLNAPDKSTFYGGGARGFTDYPLLTELEPSRSGPG
ncbi:MAG TPA: alkene reductase [Beijerinckiaceae bacterium]|nr:alkene reductase [Beijerinckiaceae bacterium]